VREDSHQKFFRIILIISRAFTTLRCIRHVEALRSVSLTLTLWGQ
jgi:hypothetical protein